MTSSHQCKDLERTSMQKDKGKAKKPAAFSNQAGGAIDGHSAGDSDTQEPGWTGARLQRALEVQ